jgi:pyruvate formate lyase activating enzyme
MSCAYCQNFEISQVNAGGKKVSPSEAVSMATEAGAGGVAFSYNEPLVWYEYVMDVFRLAKDRGLATIMKTNGYCEDSIFSMVTKATDAINIDVKGPRGLYREVCGVDLPGDPSEWPMIRNLRIAHSECIDTEVSVVAIPGFYDDAEETRSLLRAIRDAAPRAPLHILRFIPDFRMRDTPPSSVDDMRALAGLASEFFKYVYLDFAGMDNDTLCPCGKTLVRRSGIEAKYSGCQCGAKVIVE